MTYYWLVTVEVAGVFNRAAATDGQVGPLFFHVAPERLSPEALTALQTGALAHARTMQAQGALLTERTAVYVVERTCAV